MATPERVRHIERIVIVLAGLGLLGHLGLIATGRAGLLPGALADGLGTSFLGALYTPFSFILFSEVLLLVLAIPTSMTRSLGKQFEIVSLIILRRVFKDLSVFESMAPIAEHLDELVPVLLDMGGGLALFAITASFYHLDARAGEPLEEIEELPDRLIASKKIIALGLGALLFGLGFYNLFLWGHEVWAVATSGADATLDVDTIFYEDLFTIMIFTDVLLLLLSMWFRDGHETLFRDAGFIIAAVVLRLSLTITEPYSIELALAAGVFGVLVLGASRYHAWARRLGDPPGDEEPAETAA